MKKSSAGEKKILVVEDEPAICDVCWRVLTSKGFEVDTAANGEVAQDMLGKKDYDLCLIDIRTPIMNGRELYQCIQEKYPKLANGVMFTTGDVMGGDTQIFLGQGGKPFLPKPFTPEELKTIVKDTLKRMEQ
ncbi:MAG TPA: response regulator [Dehalococcoidia bacterium]|nr:response regulator [Dehalococcoidia bacterium]